MTVKLKFTILEEDWGDKETEDITVENGRVTEEQMRKIEVLELPTRGSKRRRPPPPYLSPNQNLRLYN